MSNVARYSTNVLVVMNHFAFFIKQLHKGTAHFFLPKVEKNLYGLKFFTNCIVLVAHLVRDWNREQMLREATPECLNGLATFSFPFLIELSDLQVESYPYCGTRGGGVVGNPLGFLIK